MPVFRKLAAIKRHFAPAALAAPAKPVRASGKRVQKNLTILERDAERLKRLADAEGLSQARLLSAALDAFEKDRMRK